MRTALLVGLIAAWVLAWPGPTLRAENSSGGVRVRARLRNVDLRALGLDPKRISIVRLSGDGKRLFLVQHGFARDSNLQVIDIAGRKSIRNLTLDVDKVEAVAPNQDGTRAFIVADAGRSAYLLHVDDSKAERVYDKTPERGFRFTMPLAVNTSADGKTWSRGYFLDEQSRSTGDFLVSFGNGAVERRVNLHDLIERSGGQGVVTAVSSSADGSTAAFVVQAEKSHCKLLAGSTSGVPVVVDQGFRVTGPSITDSGDSVFYHVIRDDQKTAALVLATVTDGKHLKEWPGYFTAPSIAPDGSRVLVTRVTPKPMSEQVLYASAAGGWTLRPVLPWWPAKLTVYSLARDGRTFCLWSREEILVGTLP